MYDPPAYVWALTIGGPTAIAAATCIALYSGAVRSGLGRKRAALLGGAAAGIPRRVKVTSAPSPAETAERTSHAVYRNRGPHQPVRHRLG